MTFKDINRWNVWKMPNDIIPNFNSISEETIHVPTGILFRKSCYQYLKGLRRRASLFWRQDGVLLFKILWICRIHLHQRLSDKDSQPNSSYSLKRFEPYHTRAATNAAWYWNFSAVSNREFRTTQTKLILLWREMINYITIVEMGTNRSFIHLMKCFMGIKREMCLIIPICF